MLNFVNSVYQYFTGTSNLQRPVTSQINEKAKVIVDYLNKHQAFKELAIELQNKNLYATVIPLNPEECNAEDVTTGTLKGFAGREYKIMYNESKPFETRLSAVLMECCNLLFAQEYISVNESAKTLTQGAYVFKIESIEYQAFKRFVAIAQSIEESGSVAHKALVTDEILNRSKTFTKYLSYVKYQSNHAERYRTFWNTLQ